jgi:hypothetical protein
MIKRLAYIRDNDPVFIGLSRCMAIKRNSPDVATAWEFETKEKEQM